ncbi:hypothetical protein V9L05_01455 [Bernardetia sp. Wsw4-3y2]|uniref:hypothetical protein n=1 Tax=Bernardetia sp. Wsw4-3y2 TaxID=3127471 RepID=UPI0030CCADB0
MIKGYHQMKMRNDLNLRFLDYKQDWQNKDKIEEGTFIPQIEIDQIETRLLCEMCEHAIKLNIFQPEKLEEIESLKNLLLAKLERFQSEELERRETILESESQLETIIFVLLASRTEIITKQKNKGQITFGF